MALKAQAAITDAMYFLIVVMALSTLTYVFIVPYGQSVEVHLNKQFRQAYASSALKAILYSSVPRNLNDDIKSAKEVDFFLTLLKEDYAEQSALALANQDKTVTPLSDNVKKVLAKNIIFAMNFVSPSFDYVFFIREVADTSATQKIVFVFFKITTKGENESESQTQYFYCDPLNSEEFNTFLSNFFFSSADIVKPSPTIIFLPYFRDASDLEKAPDAKPVEVNLALWTPPTELDISAPENNFGCTEFKPAASTTTS